MQKNNLNIGCGTDIREDYINLDKINHKGVDIVHDLEETPYPFTDNQFNYIYAGAVLEYLNNYKKCIKELLRILKPNGILEIDVPFNAAVCSEYHVRFFRYNSFAGFKNTTSLMNIEFNRNFKVVKRRIVFEKYFPFWYNYVCEFVFNLHPKIASFYERTFLRYLFPAYELNFKLKKTTADGVIND